MEQLYIDDSKIPYTGKGLFTMRDIAKDELIIEYVGDVTTWEAVRHDASNAYLYFVNEDFVIDARNRPDSVGRYANDARGLTRVRGLTNNSRFVNIGGRIYIKATKDIAAGSEILVDYGKDYWKTVKNNQKLLKK